MKKKLIWCLSAMLLLGLSACQKKAENNEQPAAPVVTDAPAENAADAAKPAETNPADPAIEQQANAMADDIMNQIGQVQQQPAPADVAAPPEDAIKTESGLAYKKLTANDAGKAITETDIVKLNYTGWTTDGKMFDSSLSSGEPAVFIPSNLIPGMKEALVLAKTGEKLRVWIPQNLAYDGQPGAPAGMLVFDFDVLEVLTPEMPSKDIPEDAVKLDNGIAYRIAETTENATPLKENDFVVIDFSGWTQEDGKRFHSSLETGEPLQAPISAMFPGWKAVLPNAHVGDTVEMWIPQELGIDTEGAELKGTLIFKVKVNSSIEMPSTPEDVAAPPADAAKTESGLASKVLQAGTGTEHPTANSIVKVNYSGWTTDGAMFDSSIPRGQPIEFPLGHVIPGWTEGVQLMVVGEKRRFWIPEELAYKGQPGAPAGMLVFDVELLEIKDGPALPPPPPMPPHEHEHGHDHPHELG